MRRSAWFWPLARAARSFEDHADWPSAADYDALHARMASTVGAPPLVFADNVRKQDKRQAGRVVLDELYDARIALRGEVPTRPSNWHDFFNALCFATFPHAKHALHTRQYQALRARVGDGATHLPNARTPEQDALTLFDEGGAIVATTRDGARTLRDAVGEQARAHALETLQQTDTARVIPFGHALFEHLVEGLRCPGGCTQIIELAVLPSDEDELLAQTDRALADALRDPTRFASSRECAHLRMDVVGVGPRPMALLGSSA